MLKRPGGKTFIGYPYNGDSIRMDWSAIHPITHPNNLCMLCMVRQLYNKFFWYIPIWTNILYNLFKKNEHCKEMCKFVVSC